MKKHVVLAAVAVAALLLTVGLLLQPTLAAPRVQEDTPLLTIVKTAEGDGTIAPGQTVRFTITVSNTGDITATNVTVQDDYDQVALPTIQVLSDLELGPGVAQNDGDVVTWQLGDLEPAAEWSGSYEATAAAAFEAGITEVSNDASVSANQVKIAETTVVLAVQAPKLTLTRQRERVDGEAEIVLGDTVRHTIRYSNDGTADAANVVIEERFEEKVVQQVDNVTGDGQAEGATLRWTLGTVAAGASGEVSYEVTLKRALSLGTIEVSNQATIRADDVEPVSASDSFVLRTPRLSIERKREDLNGGAIEPGDTLRFTINFGNSGEVAASDVLVRDDFDETVVAKVSKISAGGREVEGAVDWELAEPLKPDAEKTVSYEVRLISDIGESTEAANIAFICISGVVLERAKTKMTIEPPPPAPERPAEGPGAGIFAVREWIPPVFIGILAFLAMCVLAYVGAYAKYSQDEEGKKDDKGRAELDFQRIALVREGLFLTIIVSGIFILAIAEAIEPDGAISILSAIVGYVFGRETARRESRS